MASSSTAPSSSSSGPTERAGPWYLTASQVEASPSLAYFTKRCGSEAKAKAHEVERRLMTCAYLQECGQKLRLPQLTIATAIVFYHRFFARESYEHYERFQVATTALFLAAKVEETPRKLKDVVIETHKVQQQSAKAPVPVPEADSPELYKAKEMILICERELLRVLGFDLSVEHAYRPLLAYIKSITGSRDLAQVAWNFINDSLRTTICLTYAPRCVAAAATKLAAAYLNQRRKPEQNEFKLPDYQGKPWCSAFSTTLSTVEQIERTIQSMYDQKGHQSALSNASAAAKMRMAPGGNGWKQAQQQAQQQAKAEEAKAEQPGSAGKLADERPPRPAAGSGQPARAQQQESGHEPGSKRPKPEEQAAGKQSPFDTPEGQPKKVADSLPAPPAEQRDASSRPSAGKARPRGESDAPGREQGGASGPEEGGAPAAKRQRSEGAPVESAD